MLFIMSACIVLFVGCKKENKIELQVVSKTLAVKESWQIPAFCKDAITYSSTNEYCVQVSQAGVITARHYKGVGTEIRLLSKDDSKSFVVHVSPRNTLYNEPNIIFGQPKNLLGTPDASTEDAYFYMNYGVNAPYLLVMFDESNRVDSYAVLVDFDKKRDLDVFLEDRYELIGTQDGNAYYRDMLTPEEATKAIGVELFSYSGMNLWMVAYMRYPHNRDKSVLAETLKRFLK